MNASNAPIKKSKAMKRIGNLYEQIISVENLRLADEKARRGKTSTYGVRCHDKNREANIQALHEALRTKTYRTTPYDVFTIHEPKERIIYRLPYYPDRIVHHAIMNVLEPIWVRTFTHNTFSCVKERGIEGCARYVDKIIRKYDGKPLYCLKIDLRKFYPSVSHAVLKSIVRRKLKDPDLLWLLDEIIDSAVTLPEQMGSPVMDFFNVGGRRVPVYVGDTDDLTGLPIGNYLSQYLANLILCYVMHRVNEVYRVDAAEYADDITLFSDSKERLREVFIALCADLFGIRLTVKANWQIFPIADNRFDKGGRALDYVGYKFYRRQKLIRKKTKQNFCRQCARLNREQPLRDVKAYKQAVAPWLGWAKHSNSRNLLRTQIHPKYYESAL